jgi:hypothetical protein
VQVETAGPGGMTIAAGGARGSSSSTIEVATCGQTMVNGMGMTGTVGMGTGTGSMTGTGNGTGNGTGIGNGTGGMSAAAAAGIVGTVIAIAAAGVTGTGMRRKNRSTDTNAADTGMTDGWPRETCVCRLRRCRLLFLLQDLGSPSGCKERLVRQSEDVHDVFIGCDMYASAAGGLVP